MVNNFISNFKRHQDCLNYIINHICVNWKVWARGIKYESILSIIGHELLFINRLKTMKEKSIETNKQFSALKKLLTLENTSISEITKSILFVINSTFRDFTTEFSAKIQKLTKKNRVKYYQVGEKNLFCLENKLCYWMTQLHTRLNFHAKCLLKLSDQFDLLQPKIYQIIEMINELFKL